MVPCERPTLLKALHSFKSDLVKGFINTYLEYYAVKGFMTLLKAYNMAIKPTYLNRIFIPNTIAKEY